MLRSISSYGMYKGLKLWKQSNAMGNSETQFKMVKYEGKTWKAKIGLCTGWENKNAQKNKIKHVYYILFTTNKLNMTI